MALYESKRFIPVQLNNGRRYAAVSADGRDWVVVTEKAQVVGNFKSALVTTIARLQAQAVAVIATRETHSRADKQLHSQTS